MPTPATKKKTTRKKRAKVKTLAPDKKTPTLTIPAPIPLGEVLAQARAINILESATRSGRLAHAWLFHGPMGVGKFTTALALAAMLLDETTAPDLSGRLAPDPDSPVQALLTAGSHPDLHVVCKELASFSRDDTVRRSKQRSIALEVVREFLIEPAAHRPNLPGGIAKQVFIVDEAEMMRSESQNAILKTLEEPGDGTILILVTASEDQLLPTIRSRCQRVGFTPLDGAQMDAWLARTDAAIDAEERAWLLRYADGSPGRFAQAHAGGLYGWHRALVPMLERADAGRLDSMLGKAMADLIGEWATARVKAGEKRGEQVSKDAANVLGASQMFALIGAHLRPQLGDATRCEHAAWRIERLGVAEERLRANMQIGSIMDALAAELASGGV